MILWVNGKYMNDNDVTISPFDHGYLFGFSFFETFRTYNGKIVFFQEHYNRLINNANFYRIKIPYSKEILEQVIFEMTRNSNNKDAIYHIHISAGNSSSKAFELIDKYNKPNVIIYRNEVDFRKRGLEKSAIWLNTQYGQPLSVQKNIALLEIANLQEMEGIFLTSKGFVTESITGNIFWAKNGVIYTPTLKTGITPGIMRQWIIHTAKLLGYRVIEDVFIKKELEDAYECFITNTVDEIVPISHIGNAKFLGGDGPIYKQLHQVYIDEIIKTMGEIN